MYKHILQIPSLMEPKHSTDLSSWNPSKFPDMRMLGLNLVSSTTSLLPAAPSLVLRLVRLAWDTSIRGKPSANNGRSLDPSWSGVRYSLKY